MFVLSEKQQFRKSWSTAIPEFENVLTKIRNGKLTDALELINVSSGKYVYCGKAEGFEFAYKTQQGKKFLRYIFRPSLPYREAKNYTVLAELGIPVPKVLAVGETRRYLILKESFIITEFIHNTFDGRVFVPNGKFRYQHNDIRRVFCEKNIDLLVKLHDAGYFHKAFHARNLLFRGDTPENVEVFWIDVARMRKAKSMAFARMLDLHTFFRDMQLPQDELLALLARYIEKSKWQLYPDAEALLNALLTLKRRAFSRKKCGLYTDGTF